jgi:hypothetical protein
MMCGFDSASARVFRHWHSQLTRRRVRLAESAQPALLPDGRRLRGVRLAEKIVLTRDLTFYLVDELGPAIPLTMDDVLAIAAPGEMLAAFRAAERGRTRRFGWRTDRRG